MKETEGTAAQCALQCAVCSMQCVVQCSAAVHAVSLDELKFEFGEEKGFSAD